LCKFSNKECKKPNFCHGLHLLINQGFIGMLLADGIWQLAGSNHE
jgi:hypothetical protein